MKGDRGPIKKFWRRRFSKVVSFAMMVSISLGFYFGGKSYRRLGPWAINMGLKMG